MSAIMRPMNESTMSRAEMSITTPRALVLVTMVVRSSSKRTAISSCMSTWIVTRRVFPIRKIGIRSMLHSRLYRRDQVSELLEGELEGVGERCLGHHVAEVHPQVHDGLRDLRPDAADDALGAHQ